MPAKSEAQRRYLNWKFGHAWVKKHHFDNRGKLPEKVETAMYFKEWLLDENSNSDVIEVGITIAPWNKPKWNVWWRYRDGIVNNKFFGTDDKAAEAKAKEIVDHFKETLRNPNIIRQDARLEK